jgi:hypothetical protein
VLEEINPEDTGPLTCTVPNRKHITHKQTMQFRKLENRGETDTYRRHYHYILIDASERKLSKVCMCRLEKLSQIIKKECYLVNKLNMQKKEIETYRS